MDFQIYEKIFKGEDEEKKYKILKNIVYIKIKEQKDLNSFVPLLWDQLPSTILNNENLKFQNERFLLLLLLISQSLKENPAIAKNLSEKESILLKACHHFLFSFSIEKKQSFLGKLIFFFY